MASRIAQLPDVGLVSGITRPLGTVPPEFRATYQAGLVGDRLGRRLHADRSARRRPQPARRRAPTRWRATSVTSAPRSRDRAEHSESARRVLVDESPIRRRQAGPERRHRRQARRQHQRARQLHGHQLHGGQGHVRLDRPGAGGAAGQPGLRPRPSCSETRNAFERLVAARNDGNLDEINNLAATSCRGCNDKDSPQRDGEAS